MWGRLATYETRRAAPHLSPLQFPILDATTEGKTGKGRECGIMNYPIISLSNAYDKQIKRKARYMLGCQAKPDIKPVSVYFVLASDNLVKIGRSTNVPRRISNLSVLHPSFKLLGTIKTKTESEVHKIFESFRIPNTEWFHYDESMIEFIKVQNEIK
jgi:hypothetical protein